MATLKTATIDEPRKISKTVGYYVAFIALGLTTSSLGPTLPGLAEHTRTQLGEISFLFTARSLGYLVGSLRGGRWYDRVPGHRVMAIMLLMMAVMMVLVPVAPLLWLLLLAMLVLGFSEGTLDVGGNTLLVWVHRDKVGPFMNGLHFFFGVGAFLAPIVIAQAVLLSGDIVWGYWALALLILPIAAGLGRLPSPPVLAAREEQDRGIANPWLVVLFASFFFLHVGAEGSFGGWIFTYARELNLTDETNAAYLTSTFWGSLTLGRLAGIPIAARFRPRWILLGDLLICLVGLSLVLLSRGVFLAVLAGAILMGLGIASLFPTTMNFAERRLRIDGRTTGFFFVGASAGGMFLPWLIGQLLEAAGPQAIMLTIFAVLLLAVGVFFLLMAYSARHPERQG